MYREIKRREMVIQVVLFIITFGLYGIYWFYVTADEMKSITRDPNASPVLWTILLIIPILCFIGIYKHSEIFEKVSSENFNRWLMFVLWLVFSPAVWFIIQMELNKIADSYRSRYV